MNGQNYQNLSLASFRNTNFGVNYREHKKRPEVQSMAIITLTSDWGKKDHYSGMVKGMILSKIPGAIIVDITHNIPPYDLNSASFVLKNAFRTFPTETIHIIDIMSDATIEMPHAVVFYDGHYFIGTDNGVFSLMFDHEPEQIFEIDLIQDTHTFTFSAHDIFIKVAKHIFEGNPLSEVGPERKKLTEKISLQAVTSSSLIKGHVIYIDSYENVFTNITRDLFYEVCQKRPFKINFGRTRDEISKISQSYKDGSPGDIIALFSSTGHLQIAVCTGNAAGLLGLKITNTIRIEFL